MSSNIVPAAAPQVRTTLTIPSDGDSATSASIAGAFTYAANNEEAYRLLLLGGGIRRRVSCTSNTVMVIQPLGAVLATVAGVWQTAAHTVASTIDPSALVTLAASTRYWVYAYISGGAVSFEVDATAPEAGLRYMNGDTAYMYVSTFYTDNAGNILTYTQTDNEYKYLEAVTDNQPLVNGHAVVATTVNLGDSCPSQANIALLKARFSATVTDSLLMQTVTTGNLVYESWVVNTGANVEAYITHSLADGKQFKYVLGLNTTTLSVYVSGFTM